MNGDPVTPRLDLLCRATVELGAPLLIGPMPLGERRIIPIRGGRVEGERLSGEVLPGGADWQIVRGDGAAVLEARYCVRTAEGALVFIENKGLRTGPPDVLARLARGEHVAPDEYYFRTTPRFETAAPRYAWLNSVVAVGSAVRAPGAVILDFYVVSWRRMIRERACGQGVIVFFGDPPHSTAKPRLGQPGVSGSVAPRAPADVFGEVHPATPMRPVAVSFERGSMKPG